MSQEDEERQADALADVDRSSAVGLVMALLAVGARALFVMLVGRRYAVIAIPLLLAATAFLVARPGRTRHKQL